MTEIAKIAWQPCTPPPPPRPRLPRLPRRFHQRIVRNSLHNVVALLRKHPSSRSLKPKSEQVSSGTSLASSVHRRLCSIAWTLGRRLVAVNGCPWGLHRVSCACQCRVKDSRAFGPVVFNSHSSAVTGLGFRVKGLGRLEFPN